MKGVYMSPLLVWNIKRLVLKLLLLPVSAVMNIIGWFIDKYGD